MALVNLTASGTTFPAQQTVGAGDGATSADMATLLQQGANRTQYLKDRHDSTAVASSADSVASSGETVHGDTNWHDSTHVTKSVTTAVGDVLNIMANMVIKTDTSISSWVTYRIKINDGGTISYLNGAAAMVFGNAADNRQYVTLAGKYVATSLNVVITLQGQASDNTITGTLYGGYSLMVW